MSGRFTEGPWCVDVTPNPHIGDVSWREIRVAPFGTVLAEVFHDQGDPDPSISDAEADANAHLIAAAPELYEALALWVAYDDQDEADFAQAGPMLLYARAIDATRAALAKARGESQ